jgi:predicted phage terminase large subunit-like protein
MPCPEHGWRVEPDDPIEEDTIGDDGVPCDLCRGKLEVPVPTWKYRDAFWHAAARKRAGRIAYAREVLHIVTEEDRKRFPFAWMKHDSTLEGDGVRCRIVCDPNAAEKQDGDPAAIVVLMKRRGERRYHVDYAYGRAGLRGAALRERIIEVYTDYVEQGYRPIVLFEKVQAQAWGVQELEDAGIPVRGVDPGGKDKITRAEGPSLHYEMGRVTHHPRLRESDFEVQLDEFPDGEHDDFVDCVSYGIKDLEDGESGGDVAGAVSVSGREKRKPSSLREKPFRDPRYA